MCILIAEIIMLLGGLYALIAGKIRLTRNLRLEGGRARIAGLFLIAPLPLAFLAGVVLAVLFGADGATQGIAVAVELLLILGGLFGAVLFAALTKPKGAAVADGDLPDRL